MPKATPEAQRKYQREWVARRRAAWFIDKKCYRCGSTTDLQLDHRDPTTKVDHKLWSWSAARREIELAKCQVLCRPCHQWKTAGCGEHVRGLSHPRAKLSDTQVDEVRHRRPTESARSIAVDLGISTSLVYKIASGSQRNKGT